MTHKLGEQELRHFINTTDGWMNLINSVGTGCDPASGWTHVATPRMSQYFLDDLYRADGMAARIADLIVDDAFKCGWKLAYPEEADVDPERVNEINKQLAEWHKRVQFIPKCKRHKKQARVFGGSLLTMGLDDGQPAASPLNPAALRSLDFVQPVDRFQVAAFGQPVTDARSPWYGLPEFYNLQSLFGSMGGSFTFQEPLEARGQSEDDRNQLNNVTVHTSRVWRSDGVMLTERARLANQGWGDSVYERLFQCLKAWNAAMQNSGSTLNDFAISVYSIKGLQDAISANQEQLIIQRFNLQDRLKSMVNAVAIDSEGESYEKKTTNVAGLSDLVWMFAMWVSAVAGIPITLLFGVSPGGFGTGEAEGDNWDDTVKTYQEEEIGPMLEYVYNLLFQTPDFKDVPKGWEIEFNPLQLTDPVEDSDIKLKQSQTDGNYVAMGAVSPNDIARSRFGGAKYSTETTVSQESFEATEGMNDAVGVANQLNAELLEGTREAPPQGVQAASAVDVQKTALNGAQVTALQAIVEQVAEGVLPPESAISMAMFSFPSMSREEAAAMMLPAAAEAQKRKNEPNPAVPAQPVDAPPDGTQNNGGGNDRGTDDDDPSDDSTSRE